MRIYDWRTTLTTINGVPATDFAEGDDAFKAERTKDIGEPTIGVDGSCVLSLSADKSGTITVKFQQTSPTNALLQKLVDSEDSAATFVPVTIQQVDHRRLDAVTTTVGFIKKPADYTRGGKANATEWSFFFSQLFMERGDPAFDGDPAALAEALG